jgi:hypothetical protein
LRTGGIDAVAHLESPIGFIGDFQTYGGQHSAFSYQQIFALSPLGVLGDILTLKHSAITFGIGRLAMLEFPILILESKHSQELLPKAS